MVETKMIQRKAKKPNFQRTKFRAYVKLGKGQKSKRKYRKAKGIHNKIRAKWKGRPKRVEIGYKNQKNLRGLIEGKMPINVISMGDLRTIKEGDLVIIGKIGRKKKLEIIKKVEEKKAEVLNVNIKKFLKNVEDEKKRAEKKKTDRKTKKQSKEKKAEKKKRESEEKKAKGEEEKKVEKGKDKEENKETEDKK